MYDAYIYISLCLVALDNNIDSISGLFVGNFGFGCENIIIKTIILTVTNRPDPIPMQIQIRI